MTAKKRFRSKKTFQSRCDDSAAHSSRPFLASFSADARLAGVRDRSLGVFQNAGYKGLYGGLGAEAVKTRKRIPKNEQLLDRMGRTELAANQFRLTQTRDKLARQNVHNQEQAIQTHKEVGREVREAIKRIGGTLPENLPPEEPIKQVEQRVRQESPKLDLGAPESRGLTGDGD